MNSEEFIKRAARTDGDSLYASCKTCSEVASWVPYKAGGEWECQACRVGTRQFGRADREKYLLGKIGPAERRERVIRTTMKMIAFAIGAFLTWEVLKYCFPIILPAGS
jgi:hypothetical protein